MILALRNLFPALSAEIAESVEHVRKSCGACMEDIDSQGIFSSKGKEAVTVRRECCRVLFAHEHVP